MHGEKGDSNNFNGNSNGSQSPELSFYRRMQARLAQLLPSALTPLRIRIFLGYTFVLFLTLFGWEHIAASWRYIATLLAPVSALLGALLALKLGVVLVSLVTLLTALLKFFVGFLTIVLAPGILKAIFVPQLLSLLVWVHRKSVLLQNLVARLYIKAKSAFDKVAHWWSEQSLLDKALLSGFLIPLLLVLFAVFILKRALGLFAVEKFTEQIVQRLTKFVIRNFHRMPLIGGIPGVVSAKVRKLTPASAREDIIEDVKSIGKAHGNQPATDEKIESPV